MTINDLIQVLQSYHPDVQVVVAAEKEPLNVISGTIAIERMRVGDRNLPVIYIGDGSLKKP